MAKGKVLVKQPWEWDEGDLLEMITTGTKESIELDFKQSKALQNVRGRIDVRYEISKDVSALANSAGGSLIYGMCENGHVATKLDTGSDPNVVTKEWLQQVINTTIHRKIDGVRVNQVDLKIQSPGRVTYVVSVPQSMRAPHQALDKKFYKRYEFESVAMEEYEVRDLYRRGEVPDLRITFSCPDTKMIFQPEAEDSDPFPLHGAIVNDALEPANYAVIKVFIDKRLKIQSAGLTIKDGFGIVVGKQVLPVRLLTTNWGIPGNLPIFHEPFALPGDPIRLCYSIANRRGEPQFYLVGYEIKSPRMQTKSSFGLLQTQGSLIELSEQDISPEALISDTKYVRLLGIENDLAFRVMRGRKLA